MGGKPSSGHHVLEDIETFSETIEQARRIARRHGRLLVGPADLLLAILEDGRGACAYATRGGDPERAAAALAEAMIHRSAPPTVAPAGRVGIDGCLSGPLDALHRAIVRRECPAGALSVMAGLLDIVEDLQDRDPLCARVMMLDRDPVPDDPSSGDPLSGDADAGDPADSARTPVRWAAHHRPDSARPDRPGGWPPARTLHGSRKDPGGIAASAAVGQALRDLRAEAAEGRLDPVIGREREISRVVSALMRRRKRSVILHGEPGTGKTAIAEGVAILLRSHEAPATLRDLPIYELLLGELVSGTRYRGDFEERLTAVVSRIREERAILFIDEIHLVMGLGTSRPGGMDAASLLKPALARGEIPVIGATTTEELEVLRQDRAVMRRFELIAVTEPGLAEMRQILERSAWAYTLHHGLRTAPDVLEEILQLSQRFMPDRRFPDKAFDLLDRACVVARRSGVSTLGVDAVWEAASLDGLALPRHS